MLAALKSTEEDEEIQETTAGLATAKEINIDAAAANYFFKEKKQNFCEKRSFWFILFFVFDICSS